MTLDNVPSAQASSPASQPGPESAPLRLADLVGVRLEAPATVDEPALTAALDAGLSQIASLTGASPDRSSLGGADLPSGPLLTIECGTESAAAALADLGPPIGIRADGADPDREAHARLVTAEGVRLLAREPEGVLRALTGLGVDAARSGDGSLPHGELCDAPRLAWRGLSLDVCRFFVPAEEVLRILEVMALCRLNVLHLHLTDDQGWRFPVPGRPELTAGFEHYTAEELAAIVTRATELAIAVVPEMDLPGHSGALLAALPALRAPGPEIVEGFPFPVNSPDASSPVLWEVLGDAVETLCRISPASFAHIGGDESFGMPDEEHAAFVSRVASLVAGQGKRVVGWQEAARGELPPGSVIQNWVDFVPADGAAPSREEHPEAPSAAGMPQAVRDYLAGTFRKALGDVPQARRQGHRVLISHTGRAYLDRPHADHSADPAQEAVRGRLGLPYYPPVALEDLAGWDPVASSGLEADAIAGVEAAIWCETVTSTRDLELLLLPRLLVVAEAAWRCEPELWEEARERLAALAQG